MKRKYLTEWKRFLNEDKANKLAEEPEFTIKPNFLPNNFDNLCSNSFTDGPSIKVRDLFFKAHDFRASMSKFVPPTPEEEADSVKNMANIINQDRIDNPGFSRD